ncbi:hypothetical protein C4D60_Mb01t22410 [Musa balbisiana]|uniref:Uncharacterized protein n=1 Tax=Musa balbisiana TaxID=52838 RepID=A0A4S8JQ06_MUSBA|nr:hypothetical protein C4D60_Mb01t22410 [Musa balbisiana]
METKKLVACFALIVAAASATTVLAHEGHDHGAPEASPPSPGDISFLAQLTTSPRNSEHTEFSRNRKRQANKISKKNAFERLNSTSPTFYRLRCATPATPTISEAKDSRDH